MDSESILFGEDIVTITVRGDMDVVVIDTALGTTGKELIETTANGLLHLGVHTIQSFLGILIPRGDFHHFFRNQNMDACLLLLLGIMERLSCAARLHDDLCLLHHCFLLGQRLH